MRTIAIFTAALISLMSGVVPTLAATCGLRAAEVVGTSSYFASNMRIVEESPPNSISFAHKDDPRIAVVFTMGNQMEAVNGVSRTEHIERLENRLQEFAIGVRASGRWAEHSVYPYDPVAGRITYEQEVAGLGSAMVSKIQIMLSPDCLLTADFVSPNSPNLRSRWVGLHAAVADIRESARRYVVPVGWLPDRKIPSGFSSFLGGLVSPMIVILHLYFMMRQMTNLDPPSVAVRIVLGCSAIIALGAVAILRHPFMAGAQDHTFVDGGGLLLAIGLMSCVGAITAQRGTLIGLLGILIGGVALGVASAFQWTPDSYLTGALSGCLVLLGISGFYAWSEASSTARLRRAMESQDNDTKRMGAVTR